MDDLTLRQIDILKAIIKEHSATGEPVSSDILEKKYKLGVSPATIRNEMVELAKKEYLKKEHFSSGRIPSGKGFRFYIKHIMKEKEMSTADEVSYKNGIWDERKEAHRLLSQSVKVLAHKTGLLSLAATNFGDMYYSGMSNLLSKHEFLNWDLSRILFERLDEVRYWNKIFEKLLKIEGEVLFMMGEEDFSDPVFESCASVFCDFEGEKIKGIIGVVGPKRMYYDVITPQIKYFSSLIESIVKEQGL